MLDEAVQELKTGVPTVEHIEPIIEVQVEAYIDGGYIDDAMHKIEVYQRIAALRTGEQIRTLLDELIDRFGDPTKPVMNLLQVARIKNYARSLGVKSIIEKPAFLEIAFCPQPKFEVDNMLALSSRLGSIMKILPGAAQLVRIKLTPTTKKGILNYLTRLLMVLVGEDTGKIKPKE